MATLEDKKLRKKIIDGLKLSLSEIVYQQIGRTITHIGHWANSMYINGQTSSIIVYYYPLDHATKTAPPNAHLVPLDFLLYAKMPREHNKIYNIVLEPTTAPTITTGPALKEHYENARNRSKRL